MATIPAADVLSALMLGGLMGLVGQGARAIVGIKKMNEAAQQQDANAADLFMASRLLVSLFIGFVTGVVATLTLGVSKLLALDDGGIQILMGLAAAGYAGTDVVEGFASQLITPSAGGGGAGGGQAGAALANAALAAKIDAVGGQVGDLHARFVGAALAVDNAGAVDLLSSVTPAMVKRMFPATPLANITRNLPFVTAGLSWAGLTDRPMLLMALSTIRAETEGFVPISEGVSRFNTDQTPFDKYDAGTSIGKNLGNTQAGDGPRFKGRGYVQLTGRSNYTQIGPQVGADIVDNPDEANDPAIAGKILAQFLLNHEDKIRNALAKNDLKTARVAVNGGSHGLAQFTDAYSRGQVAIPNIGVAAIA